MRFLQKDTEQYHVCLGGAGIARDDERRFALRVLEGVLGGTSSSRLFQEVRERRGLAYSVFSLLEPVRRTRARSGCTWARARRTSRRRWVLAGGARALRRRTPPARRSSTRSRENLKGRVVLALESHRRAHEPPRRLVLNELPILSVDEMIERIDAVDDRASCASSRPSCSRRGGCRSPASVPTRRSFRAAIEPLEARGAHDGRRHVARRLAT